MLLSPWHPITMAFVCGLISVASSGVMDSETDPDPAAQPSQRKDENISNYTVIKHSISIPGLTKKVIQKEIILDSPANLKLECELLLDSEELQINDVAWTFENATISKNKYANNTTENKRHTSYEFAVTALNMIGTYTCIFNSTTEVKAEFHIKVPTVKSEKKPLVSYIADYIVMKCDSSIYKPKKWIWYQTNGSDQVQLNLSLIPIKYEDSSKKVNESKLHISNLSEKDSGIYICKAVFAFGEHEGQVQLSVLSYMVPLKVFLAIAAEVVVLVSLILLYEMKTKKKTSEEDIKQDADESTNLKSEDSKTLETSTTRQRKV
ncbi:embigin [Pelobates fuscus]|uniref:embigin n=1 Tax=Pelobates fuscus TaxID=191477 RepID=UPI002FE4EEAC